MSFYFIDNNTDYSKNTLGINVVSYSFDARSPSMVAHSSFSCHNHEVLEILICTAGEFSVNVDDCGHTLKKGEVLIVNPYKLHSGEWLLNSKYNEYICITFIHSKWLSFQKSVLSEKSNEITDLRCGFEEYFSSDNPDTKTIFEMFFKISSLFNEKSPESECLIISELYSFFALMFKNYYKTTPKSIYSKKNLDFIRNVTHYLTVNYAENISSKTVSDALYMPISRFCHAFKKNFGMNFSNYLSKYRVTRAAELYKHQKKPLADVAAAVGFLDYNYFSKTFKKYIGQSPARYFGKWSK